MSDVHKSLISKLKVKRAKVRGESVATSNTIRHLVSLVDDETQERMVKKFDVRLMMEKEVYLSLNLELESRRGVDLGPVYCMPDSAKAFTGYIVKSQCQNFLNALSSSGTLFFAF